MKDSSVRFGNRLICIPNRLKGGGGARLTSWFLSSPVACANRRSCPLVSFVFNERRPLEVNMGSAYLHFRASIEETLMRCVSRIYQA